MLQSDTTILQCWTEGLEDALNIDRDSFNKFHPQYKILQDYIHTILQKEIFPEVYKQIDVRSDARLRTKKRAHTEHLKQVLKTHIGSTVQLKESTSRGPSTVQVTETETGVSLNLPRLESLKTKKSHRELASALLAVFEIAMRESGREKQRARFTELVLENCWRNGEHQWPDSLSTRIVR